MKNNNPDGLRHQLKTLKDIEIIGPDGVEDSEYVRELLKREAIKWIKAHISDWGYEDSLDLMTFLNITPKEINDENK